MITHKEAVNIVKVYLSKSDSITTQGICSFESLDNTKKRCIDFNIQEKPIEIETTFPKGRENKLRTIEQANIIAEYDGCVISFNNIDKRLKKLYEGNSLMIKDCALIETNEKMRTFGLSKRNYDNFQK